MKLRASGHCAYILHVAMQPPDAQGCGTNSLQEETALSNKREREPKQDTLSINMSMTPKDKVCSEAKGEKQSETSQTVLSLHLEGKRHTCDSRAPN